MNTAFYFRYLFCFVLILLARFSSTAQLKLTISSTTSWTTSIPATDITEAGNDFTGTYTSATSQKTLSVRWPLQQNNGFSWTVSVRKSDTSWDNTARIYVHRTGNGTAVKPTTGSTISGGTSYQQITNVDQTFLLGYKGRTGIPIQYQLQGVSVIMAAKTYATTITYTITSP